jgi:hypothetical protein
MISLTPKPVWQGFAKGRGGVLNKFAMRLDGPHCFHAGHWQPSHDLRSHFNTPSPSRRSGPSQAGPIFTGRRCSADCVNPARFCFASRRVAIESVAITTNQRGSSQCANSLSCSPFFSFRWQVACKTPHRAAWPVLLRGPSWPTRWTKTWSPVPRLAVLPVRPPVASNWACRPAGRPTDLTVAFGRAKPPSRTIRASRPGGLFAFCATRGTICSTRS